MQSTSRLKYLAINIGKLARLPQRKADDSHLGIYVRRTDHLREVNNDRFSCLSTDEDVKLIIVSVNETCSGKSYDDVH